MTDVAPQVWAWFDLDDTLYDFATSSLISLDRVYVQFGLERLWPEARAWLDAYHAVNDRLWKMYSAGAIDTPTLRYQRFMEPLQSKGMPEARARRLALEADAFYLKELGRTGLTVDNALETLLEVRARGCRTGILSNGFKDVQTDKITSTGLAPLINTVVLSDEAPAPKPSKLIFDYASNKARTKASQCIMIGDNPATDIAGAIDAGWHAIWFAPRGTPDTDVPPGAHVVQSLKEVPGIIDSIFKDN